MKNDPKLEEAVLQTLGRRHASESSGGGFKCRICGDTSMTENFRPWGNHLDSEGRSEFDTEPWGGWSYDQEVCPGVWKRRL